MTLNKFITIYTRILKNVPVFSPCLQELSSPLSAFLRPIQEVSSKVMSLVAEGPKRKRVTWGSYTP